MLRLLAAGTARRSDARGSLTPSSGGLREACLFFFGADAEFAAVVFIYKVGCGDVTERRVRGSPKALLDSKQTRIEVLRGGPFRCRLQSKYRWQT